MSRAIFALIQLALAACQLPSEQTKVSENFLLPMEKEIAARVKRSDADIVLEKYDPARDQIAASECKAAYSALFLSAVAAPIPMSEQRRLEIYGRIGYGRVEALAGKPSGIDDQRFVDMVAYMHRHGYRYGGMSADEKGANLDRLAPRIALCDKALEAWGALQIDERPIRDNVAKQWEERERNLSAASKPPA